MKLIASFEDFLNNIVNLNKARIERARKGVEVVTDFIRNNDVFSEKFVDVTPQGSFRQKTIIRPATENMEFDVDLLFELKVVEDWEATNYLNALHEEFKKTDRYRDIVDRRGKTRCVTLDYESDFHIDIVPCVFKSGSYWIMNREENDFEQTDADGYAQWFAQKNSIAGSNHLIKTVRLLKYIRDKRNIAIKSVLLTTLLGNQVYDYESSASFTDVPTTLKIVCNRLDRYLQGQASVPIVANPSLPTESFNRHWDQEKYDKFRESINKISGQVDEAYNSTDVEESSEKWREVFGDEFPLDEGEEGKVAKESIARFQLGSVGHCRPVSDICNSEHLVYRVSIDAHLYSIDGRVKFRGINSDARFGSDIAIRYQARTNTPWPYEVHWQVVNTGNHATAANGLRGNFFKAKLLNGSESSNPLINWEKSLYTGKHWIECFIVKEGACVGRGGRFYVNIKNPSR